MTLGVDKSNRVLRAQGSDYILSCTAFVRCEQMNPSIEFQSHTENCGLVLARACIYTCFNTVSIASYIAYSSADQPLGPNGIKWLSCVL